ncbi:MAG: hypothetical protein IIZ47_06905, partial [Erysipelotrichaceae bacterium]|nr:hypothetical protein [Erysipelotrichaceae bacterium]
VFPYARKKGTLADTMSGHIDNGEKKRRVAEVMKRQLPLTKAYEASHIGKNTDVLVEYSKDGYSYGYAKEYFYVKTEGCLSAGEIIRVHITGAYEEGVTARPCC